MFSEQNIRFRSPDDPVSNSLLERIWSLWGDRIKKSVSSYSATHLTIEKWAFLVVGGVSQGDPLQNVGMRFTSSSWGGGGKISPNGFLHFRIVGNKFVHFSMEMRVCIIVFSRSHAWPDARLLSTSVRMALLSCKFSIILEFCSNVQYRNKISTTTNSGKA